MTRGEYNDIARLVAIAKRCGPQFLDSPESFDAVVGTGRYAATDRKVLSMARRVVNWNKEIQ
jgi:hypothetical protein